MLASFGPAMACSGTSCSSVGSSSVSGSGSNSVTSYSNTTASVGPTGDSSYSYAANSQVASASISVTCNAFNTVKDCNVTLGGSVTTVGAVSKSGSSMAFNVSTGSVMAQQVNVSRESLGSGQPGALGAEVATKWDNNVYHAPQYLPGNPTAATLYPRIIDVPCTQTNGVLNCKGYNWVPELGRGEYLMIRPVITVDTKPQVVTNTVVVTKEVLVEVPAKSKKE